MESSAECYLPILHALSRLHADGIKPRWTINVTPIVVEQLTDPAFKDEFEAYCQTKIDYAIADQKEFARQGELALQGVAAMWQRVYTKALVEFKHEWGRDIVEGFRFFQEEGLVEIITSCATHGYLPLLGTDESCHAQVKIGVESYRKAFGKQPRGIWMPECAYRPAYAWKSPVAENEQPWQRRGTEEILAQNGIEYTFVDSHMIRGGQPLGTYAANFPQLAELFARSSKYFSPPEEYRSEYEHYILPNGVTVFARDPETTVKVWSGEHGYPGDPHYLEFHKMLYPGRHRYWRISEDKRDLGKKQPYDPWTAFENIGAHAEDMVRTLKGTLARYRGLSDRSGTVVAMYDTELFGHWWWEGPEFLYELAKRLHADGEIECVSGGDVLDTDPARHMITMPEGSWGEGGYHYIWLNEENSWTWKELYPCERKLRQIAKEYADGPAERVVKQCARELLLAEASDWQFLISTESARDYAEVRFQDHVDRFKKLAEIADRVHLDGVLTKAEEKFLMECEEKDAAYRDVDLNSWTLPPRQTPGTVNSTQV